MKKRIKLVCLIIMLILILIILLFSDKVKKHSIFYKMIKREQTKDIQSIEIQDIYDEIQEQTNQQRERDSEENDNIANQNIDNNIMSQNTEMKQNSDSKDNNSVIMPHVDNVTNEKYITYEDVRENLNNENDDYKVMKKTHEIANQNGYKVKATSDIYHIYRIDSIQPIYIQTDTNWNGAKIIIHDEDITQASSTKSYPIIQIASNERNIIIENQEILKNIHINKQTIKIEQLSGYGNCMCMIYNDKKKQYIRSEYNQNEGSDQLDIFRIDNEGNVLNEIEWDFDNISKIVLIPIPKEEIIIENGEFQTNLPTKKSVEFFGYISRNIICKRSNTIIRNITHTLDDDEKIGEPYYGFIRIDTATQVSIKDCQLVSHRYDNASSYDLIIERATNIMLDNVVSEDIENPEKWGITGTNYTKDVIYKNCILNRIDAHCGVHNLKVQDCIIGIKGITIVGSGKLEIINSKRLKGKCFIDLRADYGSTWNGNIIIKDCTYETESIASLFYLKVWKDNGERHEYGYETVLPDVYIDNLLINNEDSENKIYMFYNDNYYTGNKDGNLIEEGYKLPKEIIINNYEINEGKAIKAFYQDFEELSNVKIQIDIPNRPRLQMKTENNIEYINGELTNQNISLKLETKDKIQNEIQINGQAIEEKETTLKETGNYHIIVTSTDSAGNTIQDQYEVKIDKKPPTITGIEQNKIYEKNVTPKVEDENLQSVTLRYNGKIVEDYKINTQLTKEGKYQIEAMDKAGNKTNISFEIQYLDKIENITQYKVKEKYILGISPTTTKQQFLKNATLNMKLKIYHENKEIGENEILKTGDKIQINNQSYTLIVKGDLSGDGKTNITDIMQVKRHIISKTEITKEKTMAGDINSDGKIDIKDVMLMIRMTIST